jgi:hypothetical protein
MKNGALSLIYSRTIAPFVAALLAMSLMETGSALAQGQGFNSRDSRIVLPSGTVIPVVLDTPLNSKVNQRGDKFSCIVKYGDHDAGLPDGTRVEGVVMDAIPSADGKPGELDVDFRRIIFPNGDAGTITASLYSLDGKAVRESEGRFTAASDKSKDRLKWVGIGAGGGLLIGALTKQNTLLSLLLGAGAGYLFNELGNKKAGDVNLRQGSTFGMRLDRELAFNSDGRRYSERGAQYYRGDQTYDRRTSQDTATDQRYYQRRQRTPVEDQANPGLRTYLLDENADISMRINDREIEFDQSVMPYMQADHVMVPLAATGRNAAFTYRYVSRYRTIVARGGTIRLVLGSRVAIVDGERRWLPVPAEMKDGTVYVPMEFVAWAVDGTATWDAASKMVLIDTKRNRQN